MSTRTATRGLTPRRGLARHAGGMNIYLINALLVLLVVRQIREHQLDLRQFTAWCRNQSLPLFAVRRADIEGFARDLEATGRARATVTRRLCTIAGFYKYAVEEELLEHSPAAHVRRPRVDYESHAVALDATSSARCWWPPGSGRRVSMR